MPNPKANLAGRAAHRHIGDSSGTGSRPRQSFQLRALDSGRDYFRHEEPAFEKATGAQVSRKEVPERILSSDFATERSRLAGDLQKETWKRNMKIPSPC